jgi:hypothetical protein
MILCTLRDIHLGGAPKVLSDWGWRVGGKALGSWGVWNLVICDIIFFIIHDYLIFQCSSREKVYWAAGQGFE